MKSEKFIFSPDSYDQNDYVAMQGIVTKLPEELPKHLENLQSEGLSIDLPTLKRITENDKSFNLYIQ